MSVDGAVVVGWRFTQDGGVFVWNNGALSSVTSKYNATARHVAPDAGVAVGSDPLTSRSSTPVAARWTLSSGMSTSLGDLTGGATESEARRISADKSTIVGWGTSAAGIEAFQHQGEAMYGLGDLPGGRFFLEALGVSSNGTVIVGRSLSSNGMEAFRWTTTDRMTGLRSILDGSPRPTISLAVTPTAAALRFLTEPGWRYQLERTGALAPNEAWAVVGDEILGDGIEHQESFPRSGPQGYWRLVVQPLVP